MREIKFRAWCKFENKMYNKFYIEDHMKFAFMDELIDSAKERYEIMQFTGLKDVNGVEIYESDVVEDYNRNLFTVEYNMFCSFMLYPLKNREKFLAIYPAIELKVIGNIHKNPELLLEEKTHD